MPSWKDYRLIQESIVYVVMPAILYFNVGFDVNVLLRCHKFLCNVAFIEYRYGEVKEVSSVWSTANVKEKTC